MPIDPQLTARIYAQFHLVTRGTLEQRMWQYRLMCRRLGAVMAWQQQMAMQGLPAGPREAWAQGVLFDGTEDGSDVEDREAWGDGDEEEELGLRNDSTRSAGSGAGGHACSSFDRHAEANANGYSDDQEDHDEGNKEKEEEDVDIWDCYWGPSWQLQDDRQARKQEACGCDACSIKDGVASGRDAGLCDSCNIERRHVPLISGLTSQDASLMWAEMVQFSAWSDMARASATHIYDPATSALLPGSKPALRPRLVTPLPPDQQTPAASQAGGWLGWVGSMLGLAC